MINSVSDPSRKTSAPSRIHRFLSRITLPPSHFRSAIVRSCPTSCASCPTSVPLTRSPVPVPVALVPHSEVGQSQPQIFGMGEPVMRGKPPCAPSRRRNPAGPRMARAGRQHQLCSGPAPAHGIIIGVSPKLGRPGVRREFPGEFAASGISVPCRYSQIPCRSVPAPCSVA